MDSCPSEVHRKDIKEGSTTTLQNKEAKQKRSMSEKMTVNDRSTSVSCWTLPMMCKHIDFRRHVFRWSRDHSKEDQSSLEETLLQAKDGYKNSIRRITRNKSTRSMTEADVKHVIFVMISPLLEQLGLTMNAEETINMDCMPSCRLDYILKFDDIPVGAIEVKCAGSFDENAYAQAVIQLVVLQQWAYKKGRHIHVDMIEVPIVNILTDGERFVLMKLKREKIYVQKIKPKEGSLPHKLLVRCISKDFRTVYEQLQDALSRAVSKLRQLSNSPTYESDENYTHADDSQGGAPVQGYNKYPNEIRILPLMNVIMWREFLYPLKERKRKIKKAAGGFVDGTIQGPKSLSRTFATRLGDMYYLKPKARVSEGVRQSKKRKRKKALHQ
ncbi:uncharacterized protein LOC124260083 [Haliotis rubra]|uniref:uncharacterized protein LOC124260083 n=1 Tax=Haliotis rubra TaxID=36100 RepID=UPI001EE5D852|nr:uncharacterized protein LOC124260083 [Haliotis rubra]